MAPRGAAVVLLGASLSLAITAALLQEGCGAGFTCIHDDSHGYGCAPLDKPQQMSCCSTGQGKQANCVQCPTHGKCNLQPGQIPVCPYGNVTGEGCVRTSAAEPEPPLWPDVFSVSFEEQLNGTSPPHSTRNTGRWYYDYAHRRSRFDHDKGHRNDFCVLSSLKGAESTSCRLYFTEDEQMWVALPDKELCCSLCKPNPHGFPETCSTLLPNWLQNSSFMGRVNIEGNDCEWFSKPGAVANDNWYATADGIPCEYREHYRKPGSNIDNITDHRIMFNRDTYSTEPIPHAIFALPEYCNANCTFPSQL